MHCAPCPHHTHTVFFVCYARGNTKEYNWEIKPGPRGDTVQVYTIKQVPTCPSENGLGDDNAHVRSFFPFSPCALSADNQTEDWTQLSISVWWGGAKWRSLKCIGLWKPKTLWIICMINTILICHSHMTWVFVSNTVELHRLWPFCHGGSEWTHIENGAIKSSGWCQE